MRTIGCEIQRVRQGRFDGITIQKNADRARADIERHHLARRTAERHDDGKGTEADPATSAIAPLATCFESLATMSSRDQSIHTAPSRLKRSRV